MDYFGYNISCEYFQNEERELSTSDTGDYLKNTSCSVKNFYVPYCKWHFLIMRNFEIVTSINQYSGQHFIDIRAEIYQRELRSTNLLSHSLWLNAERVNPNQELQFSESDKANLTFYSVLIAVNVSDDVGSAHKINWRLILYVCCQSTHHCVLSGLRYDEAPKDIIYSDTYKFQIILKFCSPSNHLITQHFLVGTSSQ